MGGFNTGTAGFNFGWGMYDMTSHNVNGSQIYLVRVSDGASMVWKKLWINELQFDTTWIFTTANLDGSDSTTTTINKSDFSGKLFAYHNLVDHSVLDREPAAAWDLLFTRYTAFVHQFGVDTFYAVSGVLTYPGLEVARVTGTEESTTTPADVASYSTDANIVGWDWKIAPMGPPPATWTVADSTAYFFNQGLIKTRLIFDKFEGAGTGKIVFSKTVFDFTGLGELADAVHGMYPNPATAAVKVAFNTNIKTANISVYSITGNRVGGTLVHNTSEAVLDLSGLNTGIYFVVTEADGAKSTRKLVIK
jgi:hypothetical protein